LEEEEGRTQRERKCADGKVTEEPAECGGDHSCTSCSFKLLVVEDVKDWRREEPCEEMSNFWQWR
jgi:hypothetical protein